MSYPIWLILFVVVPVVIIWLFNFSLLWRYRRSLLWAMLFALVFSIPWDIFAVKTRIWFFPPESNLGVILLHLPIEEYFFITLVTLMLGSIAIVAKYKLFKSTS